MKALERKGEAANEGMLKPAEALLDEPLCLRPGYVHGQLYLAIGGLSVNDSCKNLGCKNLVLGNCHDVLR